MLVYLGWISGLKMPENIIYNITDYEHLTMLDISKL